MSYVLFFNLFLFRLDWRSFYFHIVSDSQIEPQLIIDIVNCSWMQLCVMDEECLNANDTVTDDFATRPGQVTSGTDLFSNNAKTVTFVTPQIIPNTKIKIRAATK